MSGLDEAWAEAEAALPESALVSGLIWLPPFRGAPSEWEARAHLAPDLGADVVHAEGPTPAAALRELAAKLRGAAAPAEAREEG